jgi:hypothetical protein
MLSLRGSETTKQSHKHKEEIATLPEPARRGGVARNDTGYFLTFFIVNPGSKFHGTRVSIHHYLPREISQSESPAVADYSIGVIPHISFRAIPKRSFNLDETFLGISCCTRTK